MGERVLSFVLRENFHLPSHDGISEIYLDLLTNYQDESAHLETIILIHDVTDSHQRLLPFARRLLQGQAGLKVILMDLRGHGLSTGTRAHIDNFEDYGLDFVSVFKELKERGILREGERPVCIGQGLSAIVLLQLYQIYDFPILRHLKALALFNPILRFRGEFISRLPNWSSRVLKKGGESIKRLHLPIRFEGRSLTSLSERASDYDSHPLVSHTITLSLFAELIEVCAKLKSSCYFIDVPCFFVTSGRDYYADHKVTDIFMKGIPKELVTHNSYANLLHDLYNENLPDKFWTDLNSWMRGLK